MSQNSSPHYHQLRQALQQELQRSATRLQVSSIFSMKKFIPWLVATPIAAASLAGVLLWQQPVQPNSNSNGTLSLADFISSAQAAVEHHPDQILHQYYTTTYQFDGTPETHQMERWIGNQYYADAVYDASGNLQDKHVEVYDAAAGAQRGYDLHPIDPITNPIDVTQMDSTGVCGINMGDFAELAPMQQVSHFNDAFSSYNMETRFELLAKLLDEQIVIDLGTVNGQRGVEVTAANVRHQYWFDAATYQLKSYIEYNNDGSIERQESYSIDEYLDQSADQLPIFTDLTGLTEIHLYSAGNLGNDFFETHPTGCYDQNGNPLLETTFDVQVDDDGTIYATTNSVANEGSDN